ncbi:MAG: hypothetical protein JW994_06480 [Candidatus Omnitrophica bacterium]|nr:hypothetical protein [Candidatus Omnitrophota bacterium]
MKVNIWRIITIIALCALAFMAWYLRELNANVTEQIAQMTKERMSLSKKLIASYDLKKTLEAELASSNEEKTALQAAIENYETDIKELNGEMEKRKEESISLSDAINLKNKRISELENEIAKYEEENTRLREKLSVSFGRGKRYKNAAATDVKLEPITVESRYAKVRIKVLDVNKEYGFVVINAGENCGIKEGDTLFVFRGSRMVGEIEVERVGYDVAVAKPLYEHPKDAIRRGYTVKF